MLCWHRARDVTDLFAIDRSRLPHVPLMALWINKKKTYVHLLKVGQFVDPFIHSIPIVAFSLRATRFPLLIRNHRSYEKTNNAHKERFKDGGKDQIHRLLTIPHYFKVAMPPLRSWFHVYLEESGFLVQYTLTSRHGHGPVPARRSRTSKCLLGKLAIFSHNFVLLWLTLSSFSSLSHL